MTREPPPRRDRNRNGRDDREELREIAARAMRERGFLPEVPDDARHEVSALREPSRDELARAARDLTALPWSSIDNDESRDLDQLEVAEPLDGGVTRLRVAIADVDHLAPRGTAVDAAA